MSVTEYLQHFNYLVRYAPTDVLDEAIKMELFSHRLNQEVQLTHAPLDFLDLQTMVNKVIT